jgi:hypothetical protein
MDTDPQPSRVAETAINDDVLSRAMEAESELIVLPLQYLDTGVALYTEPSVMAVKALRAQGVDAAFLDAPEQRTFEVKKSGLETAVVAFVLGIASNAAWDGIRHLLGVGAARLRVTFVELRHGNDRRGHAGTVEGDAESVLAAIDKLRNDES